MVGLFLKSPSFVSTELLQEHLREFLCCSLVIDLWNGSDREIMKSTSGQQLTGCKEKSAAIWIYLAAMYLMKSLCKNALVTCGRVWLHLHGKCPNQKDMLNDLWRNIDKVQWPVQWDWKADKSSQQLQKYLAGQSHNPLPTSYQPLSAQAVHALAHQLTRLGTKTHTTGSTITSPFILHLVTIWTLLSWIKGPWDCRLLVYMEPLWNQGGPMPTLPPPRDGCTFRRV